MGVADEADRTLFVGNLDPKVTEELLFELFLQAGPMFKVKIPKDNDGKQKAFGFVCFKHEVSVPYGMNLLNGATLFGRTLKVQFRAGSSHINSPGNSQNQSPVNTPSPHGAGGRYDKSPDQGSIQRTFSSPDSLQRQAMMNNMWQMQQLLGVNGGFPAGGIGLLGQPPTQQLQSGGGGSWQQDSSSPRGNREGYQQDSGRDQRYPGGSETGSNRHHRSQRDDQRGEHYHHDDRSGSSGGGRNRDDRWRDGSRDGRWRRY
ncbi:RNA-binding protein 7-like isoform X1 [Salvelinus namaycush]|uniref:RNA-binding protein 7-like isoform X1 n=1 Tax=Salvelinus namaycush TaxID=8040 RepID=A0A8U0TUP8_SALNM|nr:RNA-binding protein 7-like isoform X1 [Salvelinus namaycush]